MLVELPNRADLTPVPPARRRSWSSPLDTEDERERAAWRHVNLAIEEALTLLDAGDETLTAMRQIAKHSRICAGLPLAAAAPERCIHCGEPSRAIDPETDECPRCHVYNDGFRAGGRESLEYVLEVMFSVALRDGADRDELIKRLQGLQQIREI